MRARQRVRGISTDVRVAGCCAVAAVVTSLAAALAVMGPHDFEASALVHMGNAEPMTGLALATDRHFVLYPNSSHYDGVYYYAIARDPFARGQAHRLIDLAAYRYGHPGFGWLSWIFSAGQPAALPDAMLAAALACVGIAGAGASLLARDLGLSSWWGLAVAANPGIVYSVTAVTSEPAAVAAVIVGLYAWRRRRHVLATFVLAGGCFVKEPVLLVPLGIAIYEVVGWLRIRGRARPPFRPVAALLALLALGPALYVNWYVYVWWEFLYRPTEQARDFTSRLFTGWVDTFDKAAALTGSDFGGAQIGSITIPLLVVAGLALLVGAIRSLRLDSEVQAVFLLLALTAFSLNWWNLLFPKDFVRALSVQLVLLPLVFSPRRARRDALP